MSYRTLTKEDRKGWRSCNSPTTIRSRSELVENGFTHVQHRELGQNSSELFLECILGELDFSHVKLSNPTDVEVPVDNLSVTSQAHESNTRGAGYGTVGVFRWVLDNTISKKSLAVGTGAIALSPLVDMVAVLVLSPKLKVSFEVSEKFQKQSKISKIAICYGHPN